MPAFVGCQAGRGQGCVTANGTILPCVLLPIPLGNIRTAPFADIWQSSPIVKVLQDRGNLEGKCGACSLRARCGGCRAVAYARTGNLFASDPRCWLPENLPVCTLQ
jgi:AdoMet-dependent heme synthase